MTSKKAASPKEQIIEDLKKSKKRLEYSYNKVQKIKLSALADNDEESLETLESFSSRFARFSDLVASRYLRTLALEQDPAYRGTFIDLLNLAEKMEWIQSAKVWLRIRELRNVAAHEYEAEDYKALYKELIQLTPELLKVSF